MIIFVPFTYTANHCYDNNAKHQHKYDRNHDPHDAESHTKARVSSKAYHKRTPLFTEAWDLLQEAPGRFYVRLSHHTCCSGVSAEAAAASGWAWGATVTCTGWELPAASLPPRAPASRLLRSSPIPALMPSVT